MNRSARTKLYALCFLVVAYVPLCTAAYGQNNWPTWRGPTADGHSDEKGLPVRWSKDSVLWKTPLPGSGQSSPTIWGDRIFLTSSLEQGRQRVVLCVSRKTGALQWQQVAWSGEPEPTHDMNGWASASCATDGKYVIAFFGKGGGLHCYTVEGDYVWSRDLGQFVGPWGTAASPLIVGDLVVQNCDSDEGAFLIAVDKRTGAEIWKTPRPDHRGWSSPILIHAAERDEIVLNGHVGVAAYDPASGKPLWLCECVEGRGSPTVTPAKGLLYVVNGLSGGGVYCVTPGGNGNVTGSHRKWFAGRKGRDLASPIVVANSVLVMGLRSSILTAYDATDGSEQWVKRIGGQISASPVAFQGMAFFIDESGKTLVVDPASPQKIVAENEFAGEEGELFRAAITPCNGQLFIRSDRNLYCIGAS